VKSALAPACSHSPHLLASLSPGISFALASL
jgi:hypothetical protein